MRQSDADEENDFDYLFKLVLIGDPGVGKSALVHRFKYNTFVERHASTIGVDFLIRSLMIDGKKIKLQIWDTAGQERFRTITQSYYRSAHAVIVVYDICEKETFRNVARWLKDVERYAGECRVQMLIGNKADLEDLRDVSKEEAERFAACNYMNEVLETSAKDSTNVEEAFYRAAELLKNKYEQNDIASGINDAPIILESRNVDRWGCCS